jgi:hypothetical protein
VIVFDNRLGHARAERLAQRPDRLADLRDGRISIGQLSIKIIKPSIKGRDPPFWPTYKTRR